MEATVDFLIKLEGKVDQNARKFLVLDLDVSNVFGNMTSLGKCARASMR